MAEETPSAAAPAPEPVAAPAPVAPVADPATPVVPAAEPTPAAPAEPATPATESPADESPAPAAPVAETPAPDATPAAEGGEKAAEPVAEAAPVGPKYTDFKLPEGVSMEPAQASAYTNILGKYNLTQEAGQELADFGANLVKQTQEKMAQSQLDTFAETRRGWVAEAQKKFGNRFDTVVNDAKFAISELVPDKKARADLWNVLAFTGAGDHPAVIDVMARAAKKMRERSAPATGLPPNGTKNGSPADRRYAPK